MISIEQHIKELTSYLGSVVSLQELEQKRVEFLGKNGLITLESQKLATMSIEDKKHFGKLINDYKQQITEQIALRREAIIEAEIAQKLRAEKIDITLPCRERSLGKIHPISQVTEEIIAIFGSLGFKVEQGPEIENDFNNFTALNIPEDHPARQSHDTFYMKEDSMLLRTHTSNVQIRKMSSTKPPFRFIAPGRVYRCDYDATHTPMFHQVEGVCIDKNINMGHLKGCLQEFLRIYFKADDLQMRFRPNFFPFTEPSAEVDINYRKQGDEIVIGQGDKWLEILGCGMIHPKVLQNVGIDPEEYQGFAFGMGIDRIAMLKYGIPDLRTFFEGDLRWLRKYGFSFFHGVDLMGRK